MPCSVAVMPRTQIFLGVQVQPEVVKDAAASSALQQLQERFNTLSKMHDQLSLAHADLLIQQSPRSDAVYASGGSQTHAPDPHEVWRSNLDSAVSKQEAANGSADTLQSHYVEAETSRELDDHSAAFNDAASTVSAVSAKPEGQLVGSSGKGCADTEIVASRTATLQDATVDSGKAVSGSAAQALESAAATGDLSTKRPAVASTAASARALRSNDQRKSLSSSIDVADQSLLSMASGSPDRTARPLSIGAGRKPSTLSSLSAAPMRASLSALQPTASLQRAAADLPDVSKSLAVTAAERDITTPPLLNTGEGGQQGAAAPESPTTEAPKQSSTERLVASACQPSPALMRAARAGRYTGASNAAGAGANAAAGGHSAPWPTKPGAGPLDALKRPYAVSRRLTYAAASTAASQASPLQSGAAESAAPSAPGAAAAASKAAAQSNSASAAHDPAAACGLERSPGGSLKMPEFGAGAATGSKTVPEQSSVSAEAEPVQTGSKRGRTRMSQLPAASVAEPERPSKSQPPARLGTASAFGKGLALAGASTRHSVAATGSAPASDSVSLPSQASATQQRSAWPTHSADTSSTSRRSTCAGHELHDDKENVAQEGSCVTLGPGAPPAANDQAQVANNQANAREAPAEKLDAVRARLAARRMTLAAGQGISSHPTSVPGWPQFEHGATAPSATSSMASDESFNESLRADVERSVSSSRAAALRTGRRMSLADALSSGRSTSLSYRLWLLRFLLLSLHTNELSE